ncbi:long-chain-fatty-acid-CoA ligase, putative, partial [Entamoeba invadens IP1]
MNTGLDFLHKDGDKCYINCQPQYWTGGNQEDLDYIKTHTTYEIIKRRCLRRPDNDFFGYRRLENDRYVGDYIWIKNKDVLDLVDTLAGGIISTLKLKKGDFVGIISSNRYEWYVSQFAMQRQGIVPVPLYPTLGKDSLNYIITTLNIKNVFCTFSKTVEEMYNSNPTLKLICYPTLKKVMSTIPSNINYINYTDLIEMGKKNPVEPDLPSLNDMFSVIFTSGTSGVPKGAIHTYSSSSHGAYVINTCGLFGSDGLLNGTYFSYLPSSHVLELEVAHAFFYGEGRVGIISGGIQTLAEDLKLCQPTFMVAVPRVLQKIFDKFTETINKSSYLTQFVYHMAYSYKLNAVKTNSWTYINWDYWVLSKVQEVFGGKLKDIWWMLLVTSQMTDLNFMNVGSVCPTVEF